jgi:hypothetical protein
VDTARGRTPRQIMQREEIVMKVLTKPKGKSCCSPEKAAQCCAKASRLVSGCHD